MWFRVKPDGSSKSIDFNKWVITDYDENNNKHDYHLDGYGRICKNRKYITFSVTNNYTRT